MAKVTEYPQITTMKANDILLVDGPDGTRTILKNNAAKDLGGDIIAVTKSGGKDKVTLNLTDSPVDLATEKDLDDTADALLPIGTASGNPAIVTDAKLGTTFKELKVNIEPAQSGSGDPAPDNVRPITGWTGANVYVSPTSNPADGQTYSVTFPTEAGTVYGGTLDVLSGTLTVDTVYFELNSSMNFQLHPYNNMNGVTVWLRDYIPYAESRAKGICSHSDKVGTQTSYANAIWIGVNSQSFYWLGILDILGLSTVEEFKTWLETQTVQIAYKLGDPAHYTVYQLTPQQIAALVGVNNVWADCGPVEIKYSRDTGAAIDAGDASTRAMIGEASGTTASRSLAVGEYVTVEDKLYKVTSAISAGGTLTPGSNMTETTVGEELTALYNLINS